MSATRAFAVETLRATDAAGTVTSARRRWVRPVRNRRSWGALLVLGALVLANAPVHGAAAATAATVAAFDAPLLGGPPTLAPAATAIAATADGAGYYVLRADGEVDAYGADLHDSAAPANLSPGTTATGLAVDAATGGYWVLYSDGTVTAVNAPNDGETLVPPDGWGQHPAAVAIAAAPKGAGYYVLRANGAVYGYGASVRGSLAGKLHYGATAPVLATAIAVDPATGGYWIATSTGAVVGFDAPDLGSPLASERGRYDGNPVTGLAALADGSGYYVLRADGEVDAYGATPRGSLGAASTLRVGGFASALAVDPATGGYYVALDDTPYDGYENPFRAVTSLLPQEVDQGVDYCAAGPLYAIGDGTVVSVYDNQWPSGVFISYRLESGPAKGRYVYVAEDVTPKVRIGQSVTPNTVLAVANDAKTCLETGWADPPAYPERAAAHAEYDGRNSTAYGLNFNELLAALGARPGLPQPDGPPGPLPADWPTW